MADASDESKALERIRLSESVYDSLLDAILTGQLPAGMPVSELALTKRLGVSRTPVHEAIRQLIHDGLVVQQANCRPVVVRHSRQAVHEVFEMRKILEGEAAWRAAGNIEPDMILSLRDEAQRLAKASRGKRWIRLWTDHDERFHRTIAQGSGLDRLAQDVGRYRRLHRFFNQVHTTCDVLDKALHEHLGILDALTRRDGAAAREAMVSHIHEWQHYFSRQVPVDPDRVAPASEGPSPRQDPDV